MNVLPASAPLDERWSPVGGAAGGGEGVGIVEHVIPSSFRPNPS